MKLLIFKNNSKHAKQLQYLCSPHSTQFFEYRGKYLTMWINQCWYNSHVNIHFHIQKWNSDNSIFSYWQTTTGWVESRNANMSWQPHYSNYLVTRPLKECRTYSSHPANQDNKMPINQGSMGLWLVAWQEDGLTFEKWWEEEGLSQLASKMANFLTQPWTVIVKKGTVCLMFKAKKMWQIALIWCRVLFVVPTTATKHLCFGFFLLNRTLCRYSLVL